MIRLSKAFAIVRRPEKASNSGKATMFGREDVENTKPTIGDHESMPSNLDVGAGTPLRRRETA